MTSNTLLQKSEDKLKEIVINNTPKRITIYIPDKDGNPTSIQNYINQKTLDVLKLHVDKYKELKSGSELHLGWIFPLFALIPLILSGVGSASEILSKIIAATAPACWAFRTFWTKVQLPLLIKAI